MTSGRLPYISWSVCIVKFHSIFHLSFSITASDLCSYHFSFTSIPCFLYISQWIFIPNQSCHLLYSSWANSLHSLNIFYTLFSFSTHSTFTVFLRFYVIDSYGLLLCCHSQGFSCSFQVVFCCYYHYYCYFNQYDGNIHCYVSQSWDFSIFGFCCESRH